MALPSGVVQLGTFKGAKGDKGDKGDVGTIASASATSLPAGESATVTMSGPQTSRHVAFGVPRGLPGVNAVPADEAVAAYIDATDTDTHAAARSLVEAVRPATVPGFQGLVRALLQGVTHLNWLHIGDSTSAESWNYPRRTLVERIAPAFPNMRIEYVGWSTATGWLAGEVIQAGLGASPKTLRLYNLSVAGKTTAYVQGGWRWAAAVDTKPDAISVALGFNEPATIGIFRGRLIGLVEALRAAVPMAEMVIVGQNPHRDNEQNTLRMQEAHRVAQLLGVGFADLTTAFLLHPDMASLYPAVDGTHPNGAGHTVMVEEFAKQFVTATGTPPNAQRESGLSRLGTNLTPAGFFTGWDGTGLPAGMSRSSASLQVAKNTSLYETGGFSVEATASAASQFLVMNIDARPFRGRWVTVAARIRTTSAGNVGSVTASDGTTTVNSLWNLDSDAAGAWRWAVAQVKVGDSATFINASVNVTTSGVTSGTILIDRIVTCLGMIPHDAMAA